MQCKICGSVLHYHSRGLTCRNCSFSIDHQFLSEAVCQSCDNILAESEKTTGFCGLCIFDIIKPAPIKEISHVAPRAVYSNVNQITQHQQYISDTGITEVLHGADKAVERGAQFMKNVKKRMDICFDSKAPSIVVEIDEYRNGYEDIRSRGGKIRAFTEITKDNIHYCKKLVQLVDELRHLEEMKGGIAVSDTEYMATTVLQEAKPLTQVIYSNTKEVVEQMQYIFDIFWYRAIPADRRIREIEEAIEHEKGFARQVES